MAVRANGGIITDQMLAGSLLYFKIVGSFAYAVSDDTVTLKDTGVRGGDPTVTTYHLVGLGRPVPNSLAEHVIEVLSKKCNVVDIGLVGAPGSETEMHVAISGTGFGWIDASGDVDTAAMVAAISADVGATLVVPTTSGGVAEDNTQPPQTTTVSTTVTITQTDFELA